MYFQVVKDQTPLEQMKWLFWFHGGDTTIYLDSYHFYRRNTKRHAFKAVEWYTRLDQRNNTLKEENVPLPDDVKTAALKIFTDKITVKKWNERGR